MLILMIGCPIGLRHKIIIAVKVQRNEDFTNRQFLSSQPQGIISVLPNNIFREYPCPFPPLLFGEERPEIVKEQNSQKEAKQIQ